jgi:hypothetical protein
MKVVVLTSSPRGNAARIVDYLARRRLPQVDLVGAIVDLGTRADRRRQVARLRAWLHHGGMTYALWRGWIELSSRVGKPSRSDFFQSIGELGDEHGFPVIETPNVNSSETVRVLRALSPDIGLSIGNRVMVPEVFSIPTMGVLNLHHGRIPAYRGGPPAFWELYEGQKELGVSVHRIDSRIDHGELLGEATVPLFPEDDPQKAMERALDVDYKLLEDVLCGLADDTITPLSVDRSVDRVNTLPSFSELQTLRRRLGRTVRVDDYRSARLQRIEIPEGKRYAAPLAASRPQYPSSDSEQLR